MNCSLFGGWDKEKEGILEIGSELADNRFEVLVHELDVIVELDGK